MTYFGVRKVKSGWYARVGNNYIGTFSDQVYAALQVDKWLLANRPETGYFSMNFPLQSGVETIKCGFCQQRKAVEDYSHISGISPRKHIHCQACEKDKRNLYSRNRNARKRASIEEYLKRKALETRARAKKKCWEHDLTGENLLQIFHKQGGCCALSGQSLNLPKKSGRFHDCPSVDRIDSSRGYTVDNVHLVTDRINAMKSAMTVQEFKEECRIIWEYAQRLA